MICRLMVRVSLYMSGHLGCPGSGCCVTNEGCASHSLYGATGLGNVVAHGSHEALEVVLHVEVVHEVDTLGKRDEACLHSLDVAYAGSWYMIASIGQT